MGYSDQITYNHPGVADLASAVGTSAANLMNTHDDILQRTNAVADFFEGAAATGFREAQMQMLHGFEDLIGIVSRHGMTIENVREEVHALDNNLSSLFQM